MTAVVEKDTRSTNAVGRSVVRRIRVSGWLQIDTPLHVGGLGADPSVDLALAVDGQSKFYVPGTSLAGALRAVAARVTDEAGLKNAWGWVRQGESDSGWASRMVIRDGLITSTPDEGATLAQTAIETRSGIGIDRVLGTVASNFLYARAVIPRGAFVQLRLDLESEFEQREEDPATEMLASLLRALRAGHVRLGAVRTGGLGKVTLVQDTVVEQQLNCLDGLLEAVGLGAVGLGGSDATGIPGKKITLGDGDSHEAFADHLQIKVEWRPLAPVMVGSGVDGFAVKVLPLVASSGRGHPQPDDSDDDAVLLVLPGRSIKGALRSHAERIERTVLQQDAPSVYDTRPDTPIEADGAGGTAASGRAGSGVDKGGGSRAFRAQLEQLDLTRALFGSAGAPADVDTPSPPWGVGALVVDECYSEVAIPGEIWRAVVGSSSPPEDKAAAERAREQARAPRSHERERARIGDVPRAALKEIGIDQADHVAIDRWTGGAADGRLYSTLEPYGVKWQPMTLTVDLGRLCTPATEVDGKDLPGFAPGIADAAIALLLLVLRDLKHGRVLIGYGANRGFGDVKVSAITVTGFPQAPASRRLEALLEHPTIADLEKRWRAWVAATRSGEKSS